MPKYRTVGAERRDELNPHRFIHDMRRPLEKVGDALASPTSAIVLFMILAGIGAIVPAFADITCLIGVISYFFIRSFHKKYHLPVKIPRHANILDPQELNPKGQPSMAMGTFYLGNDKNSKEEIWLSNRDAGVHMLVLGTTGSGKTELLLGICQNSLNQGSGFMFVDGKAQDKIAFKIMDLVRARGRDDDFLCLNFMTGAKDIIGPQPSKITNTMNPFSYGSAGMISQIVVGLMASGGGGDDMWKDRAISFVEALSPALVYLRDNYNVMLDVNEFRSYFELERVEQLAWKGEEKYPGLGQVLEAAQNYLINLPGYDRSKVGKRGGQGDDTKLQHGFITMQLVRAFTSLADTYGHIVRVPLGEVFFPDLVKQRRILVVMLPSLEKTPSETANIGKIIVTALRNIMAEGLGATLEGDRNDLENEEGRAMLPPYVVILDEYGYYAVKGFAVAFAQARSLGFVCVVGGQDLASFQRESKEEAVSICGNTRIKLFGSIEDPEQTMNFVVQTAGKSKIANANNFESEAGAMGMTYSDSMNVHFETVDRINPSDVKEQVEGEFHVVWRSRVIRAQTYYVNPKKVSKVRLNHFIAVPVPSREQLDDIEIMTTGLVQKMSEVSSDSPVSFRSVKYLETIAGAIEFGKSENFDSVEIGIASIIAVGRSKQSYAAGFKNNLKSGEHGDGKVSALRNAPISANGSDADDLLDMPEDLVEMDGNSPVGSGKKQENETMDYSNSSADVVSVDRISQLASMDVFTPRRESDPFDDGDNRSSNGNRKYDDRFETKPLLDYGKTVKGIATLERQLGASDEEANRSAMSIVQNIKDGTKYPKSIPEQKSKDQIEDMMSDLIFLLDE